MGGSRPDVTFADGGVRIGRGGPAGRPVRLGLLGRAPVRLRTLSGCDVRLPYADVRSAGQDRWVATTTWEADGVKARVEDTWTATDHGVRVSRHLTTSGPQGAGLAAGLQLEVDGVGEQVRFCAPAMVYSPAQHSAPGAYLYSDGRLSYPLVLLWDPATGDGATLRRASLARFDEPAQRVPGQSRFLQRTDLGSTGFTVGASRPELQAHWPYAEEDRSAMHDDKGSPAVAFAPVGGGVDTTVDYDIALTTADTFADAVGDAFRSAYESARPEPAVLPFSLEQAMDLRTRSVSQTWAEWEPMGAGFVLNFDPDRGYASQAKAFGASFTDHAMGGSRGILEYGFTGRQLNVGVTLAQRLGGGWLERSARVADFFVGSLTTPSGWVYTLYSLDERRPLYSCGDPGGPVMHYLGTSPVPGAYTRMMTEAVSDLLLCYQWHAARGERHESWLDACRSFAKFLVRAQEPDGSWFRAYAPDGAPLRSGEWFGGEPREGKASTAAPVALLLDLADELGAEGESLAASAVRAGEYVLAEQVAHDDYRGGTLDNPNVVDKEAALLAMKALLRLHTATGEESWLAGAQRAAKLAVTWHWVWDVPLLDGTRVARAGVRSTGWGGINSTWGAGVTDIYTLFFLDDLVTLSARTGDPLFSAVARLAAHGCQQILSHDGESFGFADTGMQPEGISFCDQGVDAGLIAKGDTWGGLGWPYTAGTYGLARYLSALQQA